MGWFKWASDNVELQSRDRCRIPAEDSLSEARHNAFCNFCSRTIYGTRYKCLRCSNLDSCLGCLDMATAHNEQHQLLPIVDPDIDILPDYVPLFRTLQDADIANSHRDGGLGPETVLCAKHNGEEWAQGISIIWLARETSRLVEDNGVMLPNVAASYRSSNSHPGRPPCSTPESMGASHEPGEFPEQPAVEKDPVVDRPTSFYETVVSGFSSRSQDAGTPVVDCPPVYQYEPFSSERTIRVLQLWPGSGNTQLRCDTQVIPLGEGCQYHALSYTWGDQSTGALITFNGVLLPIAQNLCDALLQLRLPDGPKTLWVDAVCINQLDDKEKSAQVTLMGDIYQEATQVLVWLGSEENDSDIAIDFLAGDVTAGSEAAGAPSHFDEDDPQSDDIMDCCNRNTTAVMEHEDECATQKRNSRATLSGTEQNQQRQLTSTKNVDEIRKIGMALLAFVRRPWWARVWIIQECALSNRDPIVLCGHRTIDLDSLGRLDGSYVLDVLQPDDPLVPSRGDIMEAFLRVTSLRATQEAFQSFRKSGSSLDLVDLLDLSEANCTATDPRDKVYGLLGLTSERCRTALAPDYSKSVAGVYIDTARFIMSSTETLRILGSCSASHCSKDPRFPSWVPNRSLPIVDRPHSQFLARHGVYNASCGYRADIKMNPDPAILETKGLAVGIISDASPVISGGHIVDQNIMTNIRKLQHFVMAVIRRFIRNMRSERDALLTVRALAMHPDPRNSDQFWRTLVEDSRENGGETESPAPDHFAELFEILLQPADVDDPLIRINLLDQYFNDDVLDRPRLKTPRASAIPDSFLPGSDEAIRRMRYLQPLLTRMRVLLERRLFLTKQACLGLGPPDCKPGDVVAVLLGGEVPFVLRKQTRDDGAMHLIGESYLSGVMHGEIIAKNTHADFESHIVTFKLC